ncbi:MAG: YcjF family protein [Rhizobiaceae bacterium]
MSAQKKQGKPAGRSPRAFKLEQQANDKSESNTSRDTGKSAPSTTGKKTRRKPRSVKPDLKVRPVDDLAAQRLPTAVQELEQIAEQLEPSPARPARRKYLSWGRILIVSLAALISLAFGLWIDQLVTSLFARNDWLGWFATGLVGIIAIALLALVSREIWGLSRMARIDGLRRDAEQIRQSNDTKQARKLVQELEGLYADRPETARGRRAVSEHRQEVIDGRDLIDLAERDLIQPLDQQARALVMASARKVSIVTAVSPRAIIDLGFVLYENLKLIRTLADHYGGKPGTLGFWRLARNVVSHLAVTGTIAVGDGLVQQLVGHGVAAKLSSRLGEGVVNGMLTARIGIAATDLCRPLPFSKGARPSVSDFMSELVNLSGGKSDDPAKEAGRD